MKINLTFLAVIFLCIVTLDARQESANSEGDSDNDKVIFSYGSKGWEMEFDERFLMNLEWRLQFRGIVDSNPDDNTFNVQRARMKVGGYAFQPYLEYYFEFDFPTLSLLNFEFTITRLDELQFKVGQWKIEYNTERFVSSGKQQFVDRTISNPFFTFDRQIGIMLKGDLFIGKIGCSSYRFGIFNGNGRMAQNDNGKFLYFGRLQWNFSRKLMKNSYSDMSRVQKPEGFIAFSAVQNISAFTSFSTSGGGQLPGYVNNDGSEQFLVRQLGMELQLKYKGFSLSSENHVKSIEDNMTSEHSLIYGGFVMVGFFPGEFIGFIPDPLEIVFRYSLVSNDALFTENMHEYGVALNWYFSGHRNKLTTDVCYLENDDFDASDDHLRFRLQWDISF